jgi:hypothetical protein
MIQPIRNLGAPVAGVKLAVHAVNNECSAHARPGRALRLPCGAR